ncbi:MAG: LPS export ABC transporter ATP-binding protein [Gammaproteobacteria bacterium]|jgi:lipopolysaccharide export system ATP-binding protein|nr:LPS export ABC transporter ATP-binding protein [Gammaproteobacteria bacterium]MBL6818812.1 LPS export ABC transporter ATP-binding protein [Gammaproteobacteria bacterium]MBL6898586.1 LPS export ABC transporter ATP-binding protein [Gammaproteobacteria bacterium]
MSLLECKNLQKSYDSQIVVDDITIHVSSGEVIGLLGPNGAGKTTTFYMAVGLIKTDLGKIIIDDVDITSSPIHKRFEHGISYLPQESSIFRDMTAIDNIKSILETGKLLSKKEKQMILDDLISKFNLESFLYTKGVQLSGGERRRVEIARALALKPKFLLLDEPFAGIDPLSVIDIQEIIKNLSIDDIGILITDHNVRETLKICDKSYVINSGKVLASGQTKDLLKNDNVKKVYLGETFKL